MAGLLWADEERWLVAGTGADGKGDRGKVAGERASVGRVQVGRSCLFLGLVGEEGRWRQKENGGD